MAARTRKSRHSRAVLGRFGLRPLHRPAGVPVLLRELGGLVRPPGRDAPFLDVALLGIRVALLRGGDDGGVDDLATHRQEACPSQGCLVGPEQHLDRRPAPQRGTRQCLAKRPDRVRIRHRIGQPEPEKAHERKPVLDQELSPLVRQAMAGLQDQHLEHQHMLERRTTASGAVGPRHSPFQIRPEKLKLHQTIQPLERVALGRKLLQTLLDIEEPGLTPHPTPPFAIRSTES